MTTLQCYVLGSIVVCGGLGIMALLMWGIAALLFHIHRNLAGYIMTVVVAGCIIYLIHSFAIALCGG